MAGSSEYIPTGTLNSPESIYLDGGPNVYYHGVPKYNPDANGYYWGITGTEATPVYTLGCYENFQLSDNAAVNEIRCDTQGVVGSVSQRNYLEATFELKSMFPLSQLKILLRWSSALTVPAEDVEYAGIGEINNQDYHLLYFSKVYDPDAGDWVSVTGHRVQFMWDGAWQFRYGDEWTVGCRVRFYSDETKPSDQRFATAVRYDPSVI